MKFIDTDGAVWTEVEDGILGYKKTFRSREYVERMYGPLVPVSGVGAPEYVSWYNPGAQLDRCLSCGSLVGDIDEHNGWHDKIQQALVSLSASATTLDNLLTEVKASVAHLSRAAR